MLNYIGYYNTVGEYEADKENLPYPNVVYIKGNDELKYNANYNTQMRIWVDDFPSDKLEEYDTIEEWKQAEIADPSGTGANPYTLTNQIIEIDDTSYYLWECDNGSACNNDGNDNVVYLLTATSDYNTLLNQSLEQNLNNDFSAFYTFLTRDKGVYETSDDKKLLKIEKI